jgi:hypothetical protein
MRGGRLLDHGDWRRGVARPGTAGESEHQRRDDRRYNDPAAAEDTDPTPRAERLETVLERPDQASLQAEDRTFTRGAQRLPTRPAGS